MGPSQTNSLRYKGSQTNSLRYKDRNPTFCVTEKTINDF